MSVDEVIAFYRSMGFFEGLSDAELLEGFEEEWGEEPDPSDPWTDLRLLARDERRVWSDDPEADVCSTNQVYRELLPEWGRISGGLLEPRDVEERWESEAGPVALRFRNHGEAHELQPVVEDDWIDLTILADLNEIIAGSGQRYAMCRDVNWALVWVAPTEQLERMAGERSLPFTELGPRDALLAAENRGQELRRRFFDLVDSELGEELRARGFVGQAPVWRKCNDAVLQVVELGAIDDSVRVAVGLHPLVMPVFGARLDPATASEPMCGIRGWVGAGAREWAIADGDGRPSAAGARDMRVRFVDEWGERLASAESTEGFARAMRPRRLLRRAGWLAGDAPPLLRAHVELSLGRAAEARKVIEQALPEVPERATRLRADLEELLRRCD